jgi:hypothetical protein
VHLTIVLLSSGAQRLFDHPAYNTFLGISLTLALKEEPKHVAVINNLIIYQF